jgi:hypothetical protein
MKQGWITLSLQNRLGILLNNIENFNLTRNIVKAIFIKVPSEVDNPTLLKNYCNDTSKEGLSGLREYCVQYAKSFDLF